MAAAVLADPSDTFAPVVGQDTPGVISLFSGAGGLDVGLERAGWDTRVATDFDRDCAETLTASQQAGIQIAERHDRTYLDGTRIVHADVAELDAAALMPPGALADWRPDLVAGGPPCQPWSSAGLQQGFDDPRGRLVEHFIRLVEELKPRFVLFENVRGLVTAVGDSGRPGDALRVIQQSLENIGFASTVALVNAADFGAAQRRVRLFLIASSDHRLPSFPDPTHAAAEELNLLEPREPWVQLGEFLARLGAPDAADVVRPSGKRADELAELVPGTGLRTTGRVEANRPGGHWGYRQDCFLADPTLPSRTIRAATTPDWVKEADGSLRRLTWRECAALQGFPPDWRFSGTVASKFRQIGNAVQADAATAIGRVILEALAEGPAPVPPETAPWPAEFHRRVRYTVAEHRVNGKHRVRVRATV